MNTEINDKGYWLKSIGFLAVIFLVGGVGYWGATARISGALIANGTVQLAKNRQIIQHVKGGVVEYLFVRDGDMVTAGQELVRLDGSAIYLELEIVEEQLKEIMVRSFRLKAERDEMVSMSSLSVENNIFSQDDHFALQLYEEIQFFEARNRAAKQKQEFLKEQSAQIDNRITGIRSQLAAVRTQLELLETLFENQQKLFDRGLIKAAKISEFQSQIANVQGQEGSLIATVADLTGQIAAKNIEMLLLNTTRQTEASSALRDLRFTEIELRNRRIALRDTIENLRIKSPVDGVVFGSKVFALKSVIKPAAPIMFVIPQGEPLVISARVDASNIDQVRIGQAASVRLRAFAEHQVKVLNASVASISADIFEEKASSGGYYTIELVPKAREMQKLGDRKLRPGMPVEAFIHKPDRSPLVYLTEPITDYLTLAFKE